MHPSILLRLKCSQGSVRPEVLASWGPGTRTKKEVRGGGGSIANFLLSCHLCWCTVPQGIINPPLLCFCLSDWPYQLETKVWPGWTDISSNSPESVSAATVVTQDTSVVIETKWGGVGGPIANYSIAQFKSNYKCPGSKIVREAGGSCPLCRSEARWSVHGNSQQLSLHLVCSYFHYLKLTVQSCLQPHVRSKALQWDPKTEAPCPEQWYAWGEEMKDQWRILAWRY